MARKLSLRVGYVPVVGITHGRQITAANTGLNYHGVSAASLVSQGATVISGNNQVISGKAFTGTVSITGSGNTLQDFTITQGGANTYGLNISGSGNTVVGGKIAPTNGTSMYCAVGVGDNAANTTLTGLDVSGAENLLQTTGSGLVVKSCYGHDASVISDTAGHVDGVEMMSGSILFQFNRWEEGPLKGDGAFNISPYAATHAVTYAQVWDNFIDGGQNHLLVDNQTTNSNAIQGVSVLRNDFGGHTNPASPGIYSPFYNRNGRAVVETTAALAATPTAVHWPSSGADANYWAECYRVVTGINPDGSAVASDTGVLSPDKSGLICTATG